MKSLADIIGTTAKVFGITARDMRGPSRKNRYSIPRQIAYGLCRETGASFPAIAIRFDRDHTTIMHGCKVYSERLHASHAKEIQLIRDHLAPPFMRGTHPVFSTSRGKETNGT